MRQFHKVLAAVIMLALVLSTIFPYIATAAIVNDVTNTDARKAAIDWAVDNGYLAAPGGNFSPNASVTEEQLVEILAKLDENYPYSDTTEMRYNYYGSLYIPLKGMTLVGARKQNVTRGEFARIYAATQRYDLSENHAVQYLYVNEITFGRNGQQTLADFNPTGNLTKGDLAVFLQRMMMKAKNYFVVEGLPTSATGKDDQKVTLPVNFLPGDGTVNVEPPETEPVDDSSNHPNALNTVQSITISKQELIANGVDSSLIKIKLKDGFGNTIPNDQSLQFRVSSESGALFSATGNGYSKAQQVVNTDGGELSIYVTAPLLTKSVVDTIKFQLIGNDSPNFAAFKNKTIDVKLRYVPKAELRLTYEVYDPNQPNAGGNVDPGIKPLPALPLGYSPDSDIIYLLDINTDQKLFDGEKEETYIGSSGTPVTGMLKVTDIQYENATLQFAKHNISVWLFEQIYDELYETMSRFGVAYTIDAEGRATYNYPNYMEPNYLNQFESDSHAVVIYLMQFIPDDKNKISLIHYDSVKAIKAIFDSFSVIDQNKLRDQFKTEIANLDAANAAVDSLKQSQIIAERPANMERFTKVIASLVAPGGQIITDFKGTVEIEFNGSRRTVGFNTNTTQYNPSTGHGGAAVVYFDDIIYGYSDVSAKIITMDPRYKDMLGSLMNVTVEEKIFTNSKFEKNACSRVMEVAYVIDQSTSMRKLDNTNFIATKTAELIAQMKAENSVAIRTSDKSFVQSKGQAVKVAATEGLFKFEPDDTRATILSSGLQVALNNFTQSGSTDKAIILVSDGKSTQSSLQNVLKQAKNAGVKVYTITVGKSADVNLTQMKRIANETGGLHYHVTDVKMLHSTYQALLDSILCEQVMPNASCDRLDLMFDEANVTIGRSYVSFNGEINSNCMNVNRVEVQFVADGANLSIPLIARGEQVFRASKSIRVFESFALYTRVEFIAYDAKGNVIGLKQVRIQ